MHAHTHGFTSHAGTWWQLRKVRAIDLSESARAAKGWRVNIHLNIIPMTLAPLIQALDLENLNHISPGPPHIRPPSSLLAHSDKWCKTMFNIYLKEDSGLEG